MACDDPTEYTFATSYLDGWEHWETLCGCTWFKPYVARWRRELEIRTKARALQQIRATADTPGKEQFQANKFLLNGGWVEKKTNGRGRPSKDEIKKAAHEQATEASIINDDFKRLELN
jgi:hypothetical protein